MSMTDCGCRCRCSLAALVVSLILGVIAAFLRITAVLTLPAALLWAALGVAALYLPVLLLTMAILGSAEVCPCLCTNLKTLGFSALGVILLGLILLLIEFATTSVAGAILTGLFVFALIALFAGTACQIRCVANCREC